MATERSFNPWRIASISLFVLGLILFGLLFVEISPGFGMVQMFILLLGLTAVTLAVFIQMYSVRPSDSPRSLQADIGIRLAATGLVFAFVSGLSDLISIGTHVQPRFGHPFVGWLQLTGIALGAISIVVGVLLYYTSRGARSSSSLEFLLREDS